MRTWVNTIRLTAMTVVPAIAMAALAGCDESLPGGFGGGGLGGGGYYYPEWGLYDPTQDIQDVIDDRWEVMDWSNDQWDEYIRQYADAHQRPSQRPRASRVGGVPAGDETHRPYPHGRPRINTAGQVGCARRWRAPPTLHWLDNGACFPGWRETGRG